MKNPRKTETARSLRKADVPAQTRLWRALRNRALDGFKFRRQHPITPYFADFACVECLLVVELDGESHLTAKVTDERRTSHLQSKGWQVIRFWNTEVYDDLEAVVEA